MPQGSQNSRSRHRRRLRALTTGARAVQAVDTDPRTSPLRLPQGTDAPSEGLRRLMHAWDKKVAVALRSDGLRDVEHRNENGTISHLMPDNGLEVVARYKPDEERYYQLAGQWLWSQTWPDHPRLEMYQRLLARLEQRLGRNALVGKPPADEYRARHLRYVNAIRCLKERSDRRIWELHAQGCTRHEIRARVRCRMKRIDAVLGRERALMLAQTGVGEGATWETARGGRTPARKPFGASKED